MSVTVHREGLEAGRLDIFVDGAFAFTLTLLAIGGAEIPKDVDRMVHLLCDVPAAAACFAQMARFWHGHVQWRTHCTRATRTGLLLSLLLVFFALIVVYPLHMVYASLFNVLSGGYLSSDFGLHSAAEVKSLFAIFGFSYFCMSGTLAWLFRHAAQVASVHGEDDFVPRLRAVLWLIPAGVGALSAIVALSLPNDAPGWTFALPGLVYSLLIGMGWISRRMRARAGRPD
ncbi:MAG TPA: TMEM175 family protein [Pinirhizobacter sp.]|uniref:TMEM175 family protein n=1 Tax=Pinirhizobacter sp. TaxID=2950432 RepID=UPI002BFB16DB|nr:TMEM175 family protein [Pinirhizobacter sp.]HMH68496.1 TMEM175 family protein [Pinirhizobacter sp.]